MGPASDMRFVNFLYESDCLVLRAPWTDFKFQTRIWKLCFCIFWCDFFKGETLVRFFKIHTWDFRSVRFTKFVRNLEASLNHFILSIVIRKWHQLSLNEYCVCRTIQKRFTERGEPNNHFRTKKLQISYHFSFTSGPIKENNCYMLGYRFHGRRQVSFVDA